MNHAKVESICISVHTLESGGGVQERRVMLANYFYKNGYDVTILVPSQPKNIIDSINPGIKVVILNEMVDRQMLHIFSFRKMYSFFKENSFNYLLVSTPTHTFITVKAHKLAGGSAKTVASVHGTSRFVGGFKQRVASFITPIVIRSVAKDVSSFVGVSQGVVDELKVILKDSIELNVIYNPVITDELLNDEAQEPDSELRKKLFCNNEHKHIIVTVGRLTEQKGIDLLIKSVANLDDNYVLVVVGGGPLEATLKKLSVSLGISNRVIFTGYKSNVLDYLKSCDCFALASRYEGFGNVLVEALYAQKPIVSSDCPHGPDEVLKYGKYGKLININDKNFIVNFSKAIVDGVNKKDNINDRWRDFTVESSANSYLQLFIK